MKPTGTCATNQYIKQINTDGSVVCGNVPYHWGVGCSTGQYIERIDSNGIPICRSVASEMQNIECPVNQYLYRQINGVMSCRAISSSGTVSIELYQCPYDYTHHSGSWASFGCLGQISNTPNCMNYTYAGGAYYRDCTYLGRLLVQSQ